MLLDTRIPLKYILRKIRYDMPIVAVVGVLTHLFTVQFENFLPHLPLSVPALLGTAISILLSFKMSQSYERWWEARKIWGSIVNDSRNLVLQLQAFLGPETSGDIKKIAHRQIAWCYSLGQALRGLNPLAGTAHLMPERERAQIAGHMNKPLAILQFNTLDISGLWREKKLDLFAHVHINSTITRLCDSMGMAERINNTVFPSTYRKFLHYIIYVFVVALSISLKDYSLVFKLSVLLFLSSGLFLIEKSAYHLQDPFMNRPSDVSVTAIARTIDINLRQLVEEEEKEVPEPPKKEENYYIM